MPRPLYRGGSGVQMAGNSNDLWDSRMKDKLETDESEHRGSPDHGFLDMCFPLQLLIPNNSLPSKNAAHENGFTSETLSSASPRSRHRLAFMLLRLCLVVIVTVALTGSLRWMISISTSSRGHIQHNYRRLQQQLVSDLWDIGELSLGSARLKELPFCSEEYEYHVPCFNASENLDVWFFHL